MFKNFIAVSIDAVNINNINKDTIMFISDDKKVLYFPMFPTEETKEIKTLTDLGSRINYHELNNLISLNIMCKSYKEDNTVDSVQLTKYENSPNYVLNTETVSEYAISSENNHSICCVNTPYSIDIYNKELPYVQDNMSVYNSFCKTTGLCISVSIITAIGTIMGILNPNVAQVIGNIDVLYLIFGFTSIMSLLSVINMSRFEDKLYTGSRIINGSASLLMNRLITLSKKNKSTCKLMHFITDVPSNCFKNRDCIEYISFITNKYNPYSSKTLTVDKSAFENCINLKSIFCSEGTTIVLNSSCFKGCTSLTSVDFTNIYLSTFGSQFARSGLIEVTINNPMSIPCGCFYQCPNLKTVNINDSNFDDSGDMFIGEESFANCNELNTVNINAAYTDICDEAFYCCSSLSSITLPITLRKIGVNAFYGTNLEDITLPNSLTRIERRAFANTPLRTIRIPESVYYLDPSTFDNCYDLNVIYLSKASNRLDIIIKELSDFAKDNNLHYVIDLY